MSAQRPPRLRNSCVDCTTAKIKCSGEKTGCGRCSKHGLDCVYLLSMAGRTSRAHKGKVLHGRPALPSSTAENSDTHADPRPYSNAATAFPPGLFAPDAFGQPAFEPSRPSSQASGMSHWEFEWQDLASPAGFGADLGFDTPGAMLPHAGQASSRGRITLPATRAPGGKDPDKQCVLAATQIINVLEASIANKSQSLDVVLQIVRKAGMGLNGLIDLQQRRGSHRCLALFGAVLHQISDLLETSVECIEVSAVTATAGASMQDAILEQLDSINELISSYRSDTQTQGGGYHTVWTRRLSEELEYHLQTVSRVMELVQRSASRVEDQAVSRGKQGHAFLEAIVAQLESLQRRLQQP